MEEDNDYALAFWETGNPYTILSDYKEEVPEKPSNPGEYWEKHWNSNERPDASAVGPTVMELVDKDNTEDYEV